jgi:hypothetical protein
MARKIQRAWRSTLRDAVSLTHAATDTAQEAARGSARRAQDARRDATRRAQDARQDATRRAKDVRREASRRAGAARDALAGRDRRKRRRWTLGSVLLSVGVGTIVGAAASKLMRLRPAEQPAEFVVPTPMVNDPVNPEPPVLGPGVDPALVKPAQMNGKPAAHAMNPVPRNDAADGPKR